MNWLFEIYKTHSVAHAISILALVCLAGMALGSLKVRGVGLGTAGVLFAGIVTGAFSKPVDHATLDFGKEFGLVLFGLHYRSPAWARFLGFLTPAGTHA